MSFPYDFNRHRIPHELGKHRMSREDIQSIIEKDEDNASPLDEDSVFYAKENVPQRMEETIRYVPCKAYRTLVPVTRHPNFSGVADLQYLMANSIVDDDHRFTLPSKPTPNELEPLFDRIRAGKPTYIPDAGSYYPPGFFDLPTSPQRLVTSTFHRTYPSSTPVAVQDVLHPKDTHQRTAFQVPLECVTLTMCDPYACLQTVDSCGVPSVSRSPGWVSWVTGLENLLQEGHRIPHLTADIDQVIEHLSISQRLCFSGLLVDPNGLCRYDIMESGLRYVFYLSDVAHLHANRLKECVDGAGAKEMEYATRTLADKGDPNTKYASWHVVRMKPGDAMFFPPGAIRFYYSSQGAFTTSGSYLTATLLHRTVDKWKAEFHVYFQHFGSFSHLVACMLFKIYRELVDNEDDSFMPLIPDVAASRLCDLASEMAKHPYFRSADYNLAEIRDKVGSIRQQLRSK